MKRLRHLWLASLALPVLFACAHKKDTVEPPAKLADIEQTLDVRKLWSGKVGKGTQRLRLALRPASDGAHVFAGGHNGEVALFDA